MSDNSLNLPFLAGVTTNETLPAPYTNGGTAIDLATKEDKSNKGIANGYAPLDANAKVPSSSLPSSSLANPLLLPLGGSINTTNGAEGGGGSINTSNGGGSINTSGSTDPGGSINTSDGGGSINTSGGGVGNGGIINTSNGGGSIDTSGGGGSILLTGLENQYFASNGGSIDLRALNAESSNGGSIIATGNYGYQGGTLNMSAGANNNGGSINIMGGAYGDGGSINMSNNGGSINTSGVAPDIGGSINTSGGGGINTSDFGGDIDTSDGGGSINTKGVGSIQFGVSNTRTTLNGSATEARTITLPNATGTVALTSDSRFTDSRTPTAHKSTHATGGTDALTPANIGAAPAVLYFRGYTFSLTGATTADVWQATYTIPANAMGPNGYITADIWASCSTSVAAKRIRVWITSVNPGNAIPIPSTVNSRIVSYSTGTSATPTSILRGFQIYNRNSVSSQIIHPSASGGAGSTTSADPFEETNFNTANPLYLVVGLQKDSTADTMLLKAVNMSVIYGS